jgi:hypothetical protein
LRIKPRRKRERYVNLRLSGDEWRELTLKAKAAGTSKSQLLRDHLGRLRITPQADRREVLRALARVGSNLNQLARWANAEKGELEALAVCMRVWRAEEELRAIEAAVAGKELEAAS